MIQFGFDFLNSLVFHFLSEEKLLHLRQLGVSCLQLGSINTLKIFKFWFDQILLRLYALFFQSCLNLLLHFRGGPILSKIRCNLPHRFKIDTASRPYLIIGCEVMLFLFPCCLDLRKILLYNLLVHTKCVFSLKPQPFDTRKWLDQLLGCVLV